MVIKELVSRGNGRSGLVMVVAHLAAVNLPAWLLNLQHEV